jgi:hypothetical protein
MILKNVNLLDRDKVVSNDVTIVELGDGDVMTSSISAEDGRCAITCSSCEVGEIGTYDPKKKVEPVSVLIVFKNIESAKVFQNRIINIINFFEHAK